jgi:GxxExxY protein
MERGEAPGEQPDSAGNSGRGGLRMESSLPSDLDDLIHRVIGAALEVHRQLGPGFLESIYERAVCHELDLRGIRYECQKDIVVPYKDLAISGQRLDLLVEGCLVIELKAVDAISPLHEAQIISYLKATGCRAGLILNFQVTQLRAGIRRLVR